MPNQNNLIPGGTKITAPPYGLKTWQNTLATPGTTGGGANTATAVAARYASLWIPGDVFITSINFLQGLTAATTKVIGALYDSGGNVLAYSAIAGVVMSGASTYLSLPLTTPYSFQGPGLAFIGLIFDGTGSTYGTIPVNCNGGSLGGSSVATFTTPVPLIISATPFTDAQAPIAFLA